MTQASQSTPLARPSRLVALGSALAVTAALVPAYAQANTSAPIPIEVASAPAAGGGAPAGEIVIEAGAPAPATATAMRPIVIDTATLESLINPEPVRDAIARELGRPVIAPDAPEATLARERLVLRPFANGRVLVSFHDASGRTLRRALPLDADATASTRTIALLAGNLARNEARDLAASLGRPAMRNASGPQGGGGGQANNQPARGTSLELPQMDIAGDGSVSESPPPSSEPSAPEPIDPSLLEPPRARRARPTLDPELSGGALRDRPAPRPSETYEYRHGGRIAVAAFGGLGTASGGFAQAVTVGARYRWRYVAVGLDVSYTAVTIPGMTTFSSTGMPITSMPDQQTRVPISPMLWFNIHGGPLRIELGAGAGLMYLNGNAQAVGGRGVVFPNSEALNATARATAAIAFSFPGAGRFLDVVLLNDALFPFAALTAPPRGFLPQVGGPQFIASLGLQGRFGRW